MPGGTPLSGFSDFWMSTGPLIASSPDEIINDAQLRTYSLKYFLKGRDFSSVAQGGTKIKDELQLTDKATAENYKPGQTGTPTQPQILSSIESNWRFTRDHSAWQDEILQLQTGGLNKKAKFHVYKKEATKLEQGLWTSILNKMEANIWANPHGSAAATAMETEAGGDPYSIPALLTEDTTNWHPNGWTTVHGLDPSTEANWRNPVTRYNVQDLLDTASLAAGLFDAFEMMWMKLRFMTPGKGDSSFMENDPRRCAIFCSETGKMQYSSACRASNDRLRMANDPDYGDVNFHGVPLVNLEVLNTATLYLHTTSTAAAEDSSSLTLGGAWSATNWTRGPRYWFLNPNVFRYYFHETMFFDKTPPKDHVNQPWANVVWMRVAYNALLRSRKRGGGVVSPGGTANAA